VTNTHVVKQPDLETGDVFVIFNDGYVTRASIQSYDYLSDVAVLKVDRQGLQAAVLGNSRQLKVGQEVVAIGNPLSLGLRNTVTAGVISGLNRADQSAYPLIQTDAAINSGNSGGPLVNYKGEVIGITSSKIAAFGVEGLGFAIPIHIVQDIMARFVDGGITRPFLGAVVDEPPFVSLGIPGSRGLTVVELSPAGPARAAGILVDDVVTSVNGVAVLSLLDLRSQLERHQPGARITIGIRRGQNVSTVTVTLGSVSRDDEWPFEYGALYPWEAEY
jgi:serine protease Do